MKTLPMCLSFLRSFVLSTRNGWAKWDLSACILLVLSMFVCVRKRSAKIKMLGEDLRRDENKTSFKHKNLFRYFLWIYFNQFFLFILVKNRIVVLNATMPHADVIWLLAIWERMHDTNKMEHSHHHDELWKPKQLIRLRRKFSIIVSLERWWLTATSTTMTFPCSIRII